jgi:hypothetical protein
LFFFIIKNHSADLSGSSDPKTNSGVNYRNYPKPCVCSSSPQKLDIYFVTDNGDSEISGSFLPSLLGYTCGVGVVAGAVSGAILLPGFVFIYMPYKAIMCLYNKYQDRQKKKYGNNKLKNKDIKKKFI